MKTTKPNFKIAQTALTSIATGFALLTILALQTTVWVTATYAIPAANRGIQAIARKIAKPEAAKPEPIATKELSPAPEPIPQPSPIPDNVAIAIAEPEAKPAKPKAKSASAKSQGKGTPKDKTIAALIITEAAK